MKKWVKLNLIENNTKCLVWNFGTDLGNIALATAVKAAVATVLMVLSRMSLVNNSRTVPFRKLKFYTDLYRLTMHFYAKFCFCTIQYCTVLNCTYSNSTSYPNHPNTQTAKAWRNIFQNYIFCTIQYVYCIVLYSILYWTVHTITVQFGVPQ